MATALTLLLYGLAALAAAWIPRREPAWLDALLTLSGEAAMVTGGVGLALAAVAT